jgi:hypothetical protein
MCIQELLTAHPRSVGETYGEHMWVALSFAGEGRRRCLRPRLPALPLRPNGKPDD